jgi:DNA end-binding protein Ku
MSARATWKGVLTVSLVTIPIKVYPATESSAGIPFNQLHGECQTRMQQKRWCPHCNREVPSAEIVKGYEFEKGRYVLVLEDELDAVQPPSTRVIDLTEFAALTALDPLYIDRTYYLAPDGVPAGEAYVVLRDAMVGRVGIGTVAIYGREYLVAVRPRGQALLLHTLHHAAEIRAVDEAVGHVPLVIEQAQVKLARKVIDALAQPLLHLAAFTDAYRAGVQQLIDAKIAGEEIVVPALEMPEVLSLKMALEQSLAAVNAKPAKASTIHQERARRRRLRA